MAVPVFHITFVHKSKEGKKIFVNLHYLAIPVNSSYLKAQSGQIHITRSSIHIAMYFVGDDIE